MADNPDADSPETLLAEAQSSLRNAEDEGVISTDEYDRIDELLRAYNEDTPSVAKPTGDYHRKKSTLATWCNRLRIAAMRCPVDLTEADARDINRYWDTVLNGRHDDVKDSGLSQNTVSGEQSTVRRFYEYHDDLGVDKEELTIVGPVKETVDERDVYSGEEIDAIRDAVDNPRDKALVDLFLYTGQRIRAVQTLRVRDIDLDEGIFYLNTDDGGLKDAEGKRPLLAAEASLRDWLLDYHPNSEDPDSYVITHRPKYKKDHNADSPLRQKSIRRILDGMVDRANVDKPSNPHNFRHSFVTIAKRDYNMDDTDIKALIGHRIDSRVMEETYTHLTDEDHIEAAQTAVGVREEDDKSPFTPEVCPNPRCREPLPNNAVSCPKCGINFGPNAISAQEKMEEASKEGMLEADPDDPEHQQAVEHVDEKLAENPALATYMADALDKAIDDANEELLGDD